MTSQDPLSVVLPVHNGALQLPARVEMLLELLADITSTFELLIVDNGSDDRSEEVAYELARDFPQLRVVRHAQHRPQQELVRTGLKHTCGEYVIVCDEEARIPLSELQKVWATRHEPTSVSDERVCEQQSSLVGRLASWASQLPKTSPEVRSCAGLRMVRRQDVA